MRTPRDDSRVAGYLEVIESGGLPLWIGRVYGGSKNPLRACTVNFLSFAFSSSL
jgi:hypothetical protein